MRNLFRGFGLGVAMAALAACGDGGTDTRRLDGLEKRLDALEERLGAAADTAETVERLSNDAAGLDRRLSAIESGVRELAARAPAGAGGAAGTTPTTVAPAARPSGPTSGTLPSGGPAAWGPTTRLERTERRAQLRALSEEFRAKISEMRTDGKEDHQEDTRALLEWYRDQRRAILRGGGRTDQQ